MRAEVLHALHGPLAHLNIRVGKRSLFFFPGFFALMDGFFPVEALWRVFPVPASCFLCLRMIVDPFSRALLGAPGLSGFLDRTPPSVSQRALPLLISRRTTCRALRLFLVPFSFSSFYFAEDCPGLFVLEGALPFH